MTALRRRAPTALALLLAVAASGLAQEAPPDATTTAPPAIVARGAGELVVEQQSRPLPWARTAGGPLVAITPVVVRLGGQLEAGALGEGYSLTLGDATALIAPGSPSLASGEEILALSQAPLVLDGELMVPIDLLQRTYGAVLGIGFEWAEPGRLIVSRPQSRDLPVEVDLVHLQGISTLVFRFPEPPRYRVRPREGGLDVELLGDRLLPPARQSWGEDPLVRAIGIAPDRIRIDLSPDCRADHYELREPFRLVFDVVRASEAAAPVAPATRGPRRRELRTIVVDPGHGGSETGAIGPAGTAEKELTLQIARELETRLEQRLGVQVLLTRTEDVDLALDDRAALANQHRADLFVSVHLNSSPRGGARGAETYLLSLQASDQRAASTAALENLQARPAAAGAEEVDPGLQLILWDLAQSQHLAASQHFAALVQEELNAELQLTDRGVKQAPFRVLMGAAMPAVLVELGFLSTREEEERLRTPAYRAALAEALVRAIGRFKAEVEGTAAPAVPATPAVPQALAPPERTP